MWLYLCRGPFIPRPLNKLDPVVRSGNTFPVISCEFVAVLIIISLLLSDAQLAEPLPRVSLSARLVLPYDLVNWQKLPFSGMAKSHRKIIHFACSLNIGFSPDFADWQNPKFS